MDSDSLLAILRLLESFGIAVWLDGGWGVDALLGEQTRPHKDLDVIVCLEDVSLMMSTLGRQGFELVEGRTDSNFVLRDAGGRHIDVHTVRFDGAGNGVYRMLNGQNWVYPAAGFGGTGTVAGRQVRCLTAEVQMLCHTGYEPAEKDLREMRLLQERFGVEIPKEYRGICSDRS